MRLAPIALFTAAAALISGHGLSSPAPDSSDFTIRTRTTVGGQRARSQSTVLQIKGMRQRIVDGPSGVQIIQCDARRSLFINDRQRLYASVPLRDDSGPVPAAALARFTADTRPVAETVTIDAVDTGERRPIGPFTARRVVTTTTTERHDDKPARTRTRIQDGWYLDIPIRKCGATGHETASVFLVGTVSKGRTEIRWKGTARTGWPVIETDSSTDPHGTFVRTTSLIEASAAPLDSALFDVPHGYRPALPLGNGGFDLEKPDTVVNRVRHVVETAASWVHYAWSRIGSRSRGW